MKGSLLFLCICCATLLFGQDSYHSELIGFLSEEYNLTEPGYVLFDNESEIIQNKYIYGNVQSNEISDNDLGFSNYTSIEVASPGENPWDAGYGIRNVAQINKGDAVIVHFWARRNSSSGSVNAFSEDGSTFDKEFFNFFELTSDWTSYFYSFKSSKTFAPDAMALGFHLASEVQHIDIGGFTALNYGQGPALEDLPSSFLPANYGGHEADATWRTGAQDRIDNIRKANLDITVVGKDGLPVEGAEIHIEMQEHEFGFGSAFAMNRFPGGRDFNETYFKKILDLDGKGHGFNVGVNENALKWDGWEEQWIGTPDQTKSAIQLLVNSGVEMRGHVLVWPGYGNLPNDIHGSNIDYINERIEERLTEMLTDPVLSQNLPEWDILNEITTNRDLEMLYQGKSGYETGRELYQEIIAKAKELAPDKSFYVNDYIVLSGGGSSPAVVNRYKGYLDEMAAADSGFDGIGFQCHIGSIPTSITKIESVLNDFYDRYDVRMKITEFDIEPSVDPETAAIYTSDFLTMVFSHPGVDAFVMWGFWDNNHWKNNALMFNSDWTIKPAGQVFVDKVFGEWWTDELLSTDASGQITNRAFKGKQLVTVTHNGVSRDTLVDLTGDVSFEFQADFTSTVQDPILSQIELFPNPVSDQILQLHIPNELADVNVKIITLAGQVIQEFTNVKSDASLSLEAGAGVYLAQFRQGDRVATQKIVVLD